MGRWITKNGNKLYIDEYTSLSDALSEYYSEHKLPTVFIERKEYGHVMHEINTWYRKEYKDSFIISKAIDNYVYTFENRGYNEYRFIGRDLINSEDD